MAENIPDVDQVKIRALDAFFNAFGESATHCVCAPGRVNVIGEHTDYNEGFVLPMVIEDFEFLIIIRPIKKKKKLSLGYLLPFFKLKSISNSI